MAMADFLIDYYLYFKAFHVVAFVAWMAGLLYLPRLYVYHAETQSRDVKSQFIIMERRLLRYIMNPAMIAVFTLGFLMIVANPYVMGGWLHVKLLLVLILAGFHMFLARCRKNFAADRNTYKAKTFRVLNEVPTLLLIAIAVLAVVKPF